MIVSGKRPVMFYQEGTRCWGAQCGPRVRIFYPNGKTEWCSLTSSTTLYDFNDPPCWTYNNKGNPMKPRGIAKAMRMAQEYDAEQGFPKMEFLGEL
jgi:hypothetical protein